MATEDTVEKVLKPCPFCGDDEELRIEPDKACACPCYWWVVCGACGGRMFAEGKGGAIAAWNTRAAINAMSDVRERLNDAQSALTKLNDHDPNNLLEYAMHMLDAALESLSGGGGE